MPKSNAAVHRAATNFNQIGFWHLRIVVPELLAAAGVECIDMTPAGADINYTVVHERGCLHAACCFEFKRPGEIKLVNVVAIYLLKRAKALFGIVAAITQPFRTRIGYGVVVNGRCRAQQRRKTCCECQCGEL